MPCFGARFSFATSRLITGEVYQWLYVAPPFFVLGALVALACFDLDFSNGFLHYSFYVLLTMLLRVDCRHAVAVASSRRECLRPMNALAKIPEITGVVRARAWCGFRPSSTCR